MDKDKQGSFRNLDELYSKIVRVFFSVFCLLLLSICFSSSNLIAGSRWVQNNEQIFVLEKEINDSESFYIVSKDKKNSNLKKNQLLLGFDPEYQVFRCLVKVKKSIKSKKIEVKLLKGMNAKGLEFVTLKNLDRDLLKMMKSSDITAKDMLDRSLSSYMDPNSFMGNTFNPFAKFYTIEDVKKRGNSKIAIFNDFTKSLNSYEIGEKFLILSEDFRRVIGEGSIFRFGKDGQKIRGLITQSSHNNLLNKHVVFFKELSREFLARLEENKLTEEQAYELLLEIDLLRNPILQFTVGIGSPSPFHSIGPITGVSHEIYLSNYFVGLSLYLPEIYSLPWTNFIGIEGEYSFISKKSEKVENAISIAPSEYQAKQQYTKLGLCLSPIWNDLKFKLCYSPYYVIKEDLDIVYEKSENEAYKSAQELTMLQFAMEYLVFKVAYIGFDYTLQLSGKGILKESPQDALSEDLAEVRRNETKFYVGTRYDLASRYYLEFSLGSQSIKHSFSSFSKDENGDLKFYDTSSSSYFLNLKFSFN